MRNVLTCVAYDHDWRLVLLSVAICAVASYAALAMRARRGTGYSASPWWLAVSGICFGCGVWATHFIGMLAFRSPIPLTYDLIPTVSSSAVAVAGAMAAFFIADRPAPAGPLLGGMVLGVAIAAMHFLGMAGMNGPQLVMHETAAVIAAVVAGIAFGACALLVDTRDSSVLRRSGCTALLILAVGGTHFIAMSGTTIVPGFVPPVDLGAGAAGTPAANTALAIAVAAVTGLVLVLGALAVILDRRADSETDLVRTLVSATFDGMLIHRDGIVLDANETFCRMAGTELSGLVGRHVCDFIAEQDIALVARKIASPISKPFVVTIATPDGRHCRVEALGHDIMRADGRARVVAVRDLTELERAEERVRQIAHHDVLTDLPNRMVIAARLSEALKESARAGAQTALLAVDIDRFKAVNDLLGHEVGDHLLVQAGRRLRACLRVQDTVARAGGDEFTVILPCLANADIANEVARRMVETLGLPFEVDGVHVSISASIGIAVSPAHETDADTLLRHADIALEAAKEAGPGYACPFDGSMAQRVHVRRQLEQDLRRAVARNQFELFYQPIVACPTGQVVGYEALVRWNHPERGRVSPAEFIPLAEETGLIIEIGRWVLETACTQAASWPLPRRVAVNLSPVQFRQPDLLDMVIDILARTGLPPTYLELEVTEGVLIADVTAAARILHGLKAAGVEIALDDFGTGYSSMTYLRRFPFDRIKIDQAFVRELGDDQGALAIVDAILTLAGGLHMQVTAEGVETEIQLELLRARGCDNVQGYFLGRPAPAKDLDFSGARIDEVRGAIVAH